MALKNIDHLIYRPDIDGLRAIAVLAVVAFHAFPNTLKGGFAGVDIFFVISGYLISTIVFKALANESFGFIAFYDRRIRRIFPSLLVVLWTCFFFGWVAIQPETYQEIGKHTAGGAAFIANLIYYGESGYFDTISERKPLLHLWSLGIEEQFYLLWPLVLYGCHRLKINLLMATLTLGCASLAINFFVLHSGDRTTAFFMPHTRFWELLAGAMLARLQLDSNGNGCPVSRTAWFIDKFNPCLIQSQSTRNFGSLLGLALLVLSLVALREKHTAYPVWAVVPVMASLLILWSGPNAWANKTLLSRKSLVWVGLISYPLYLWHWPLLSFARILEGDLPSIHVRGAMVISAIVLAFATYRLVERPLRFGVSKFISIALSVCMATVGFLGYYAYSNEGVPDRAYSLPYKSFSESIKRTARSAECFDIENAHNKAGQWFCDLGSPSNKAEYFVFGDSHALSLIPALEKYAAELQTNILFSGTSACPPLLGVQTVRADTWLEKHDCRRLNDRVFGYVRDKKIKTLILIARWSYYVGGTTRPEELSLITTGAQGKATKSTSAEAFVQALSETVKQYRSIGVRLVFVLDNPQQMHDPRDIMQTSKPDASSINSRAISRREHEKNQALSNGNLLAYKDHVKIVDVTDTICNVDTCDIVKDGKSLYFDDDHLSIDGALLVYPLLKKILDRP